MYFGEFMYKVITVSKKTGEEEGYLGEFEDKQEAIDVANDFNRKADRHPSIAQVLKLEEEVFFEENYNNPNQDFNLFFEDDSEEVEYSSEEESEEVEYSNEEESEEINYNNEYDNTSFNLSSLTTNRQIQQQQQTRRIRDTSSIRRLRERVNEHQRITERNNPIIEEKPQTRTFTSLVSEQSSERIKSRNKHEMQYNKDRFMFRDVGSNTSLTSMRKTSTNPFMFQGQIEKAIMGIIIKDNKVLIREVANHYRGITWDFYGGTPEHNETEEETVFREVKEETGYNTKIITYVSDYTYKNRILKFYLLEKIGKQEQWKDFSTSEEETWSTRWVTKEQAWNYFKLNSDELYKRILRNALDEAFHKYKLKNMRY